MRVIKHFIKRVMTKILIYEVSIDKDAIYYLLKKKIVFSKNFNLVEEEKEEKKEEGKEKNK